MNKYPVAKILREFGTRGEIKIKIYFTPPFYFKNYKKIFINHPSLGFVELEVEKFKLQFDKYALIKFKNINTREEAKKLKGFEIFVLEEMLPPKEKDEYYVYELENLNVYYKGKVIGYIKDVIIQGNYTLLKIKTDYDEIYIPFTKTFIEQIDLKKRICILKNLDEAIINP